VSWWDELDPDIRSDARALVAWVQAMGGSASVTSVRRSSRLERRIAGRGFVSEHLTGRAFDVVIEPTELAQIAGMTWRRMGGRWSEKDPIHFER
jgi:uncharacterized protein YcbK (DUF882 family)